MNATTPTPLSRLIKRLRSRRAQSMTEFALTLPFLLLLIFGIIDFGRLLQAWLALENGARFGVRYASTGSFNPAYCQQAAAALEVEYPGISSEDSDHNCRVTQGVDDEDDKNDALQDLARLPSIRDTAIAGAMGVAWDPAVSGDYNTYLHQAFRTSSFSQDNRGIPGIKGYLNVMICSNRVFPNGNRIVVNNNPAYYNPYPVGKQEDYRFPAVCEEFTNDFSSIVRFVDDAGGPGDRVRVVLTYRHTIITPILNTWWPTLRLHSEREALVEKFRTSRVTGLTGGIMYAPTQTFTPSPAPTTTNTPTPTATPAALTCNGVGSILRQTWLGVSGSSISNLTSHYQYPFNPNSNDYPTVFNQSSSSVDNFGTRWRAYLCPPYTGSYTFFIASDDSSQLLLSGSQDAGGANTIASVNGYTNYQQWNKYSSQTSSTYTLNGGQLYYIEALQKEGSGGDHLSVGWIGPGPMMPQSITVIDGQYLVPLAPEPTPTPEPPTCDALVALEGQNNNQGETLLIESSSAQFSAWLRNVSAHSVYLTGANLTYNGAWHNDMQASPGTHTFHRYRWGGSTTIYDPPNGTYPLNHTFSSPYLISALSEGAFSWAYASPSKFGISPAIQQYPAPGAGTPTPAINPNPAPSGNINFYWTSDFDASISYKVVPQAGPTVVCTLDLTGLQGPAIAPVISANPVRGPFYIGATVNGNNTNVDWTYFYVYNSSGTLVHWFKDTSNPFCFNNNCANFTPNVSTWWMGSSSNPGPLITNGNYTLAVMAQDRDPRRKANLEVITFSINGVTPTPSRTATITLTPSRTPTRTNTLPPTMTFTPTRTGTKTSTPTRTLSPTPTNTRAPSRTPTITRTPTRTLTPTPCLTPFEMGGCR